MSVSQNLKFSVGRVFECPDFEFELDFDRQTPHSFAGQNPESAVRRRLASTRLVALARGQGPCDLHSLYARTIQKNYKKLGSPDMAKLNEIF